MKQDQRRNDAHLGWNHAWSIRLQAEGCMPILQASDDGEGDAAIHVAGPVAGMTGLKRGGYMKVQVWDSTVVKGSAVMAIVILLISM